MLGALDDIRDVNEAGIRTLVEAHRWGGTTFHDSGWNPRHIEGVDHFLFYNLERMTGTHFIHGQPVGLGTVAGSLLQGNEPDEMLAALHRVGVDIRPEAMGVTWDAVAEAAADAPRRSSARPASGTRSPTSAIWTDDLIAELRAMVTGTFGAWEEAAVKLGLTLPQGCDREYLGVEPSRAWQRTVEIARWRSRWASNRCGCTTTSRSTRRPRRRRSSSRSSSCPRSRWQPSRVRLGHLVLAAAYRPAALTAKMISSLDVVSGGRVELGIGAGWKEDEWIAYGYGFPSRTRPARDPGGPSRGHHPDARAGSCHLRGTHARVDDAIHEPKGLAAAGMPILIGGNGPNVTWRLAARFADELNLDALMPDEVAEALPVIR